MKILNSTLCRTMKITLTFIKKYCPIKLSPVIFNVILVNFIQLNHLIKCITHDSQIIIFYFVFVIIIVHQ